VQILRKMILVLAIFASSLTFAAPAQAETCQDAITLWAGTPWERSFPRVCGEEARLALWNNELGPYLNANSAAVSAWNEARAAEQAAQAAAEAAAAQAAAAQAAAAAAAADAANCVDMTTSFLGDMRWERTFPAVCTASGIAARAAEMDNYFNYVTAQRVAEQNSAPTTPQAPPVVPPPPPGGYINNPEIGIDCGTYSGMQTAWCMNQQQGYNPITGVWGPPPAPAPMPTVPTSQDCTLPQNAALPFCTNNLPMTNTDGSINCAQPQNAITTTCMDLFKASSSGQLDCSRPELISMPICVIGSSTNNAAPASSAPMQSPNLGLPAPTMGVAPQPTVPVTTPTSSAPGNSEKSSEKISQNKDELFAEEDGEEEPPAGTLEVSYSAPSSRYVVKVECNLAGEKVTVRAVKKGAKALRFTISIDEDGVGGVRTKSKLAGYTLTLYYGNTKLDQVRVK
jgi:hypothetical protein